MLNASRLKQAHRMLPDSVLVTVTPQNPAAEPVAMVRAYRRPWSTEELRAYGGEIGLEVDKAVFLIPTESLATVKTWWKITDADGTWSIKSVTRELAGTMNRCTCVKDIE